jgi:hypothetical protein
MYSEASVVFGYSAIQRVRIVNCSVIVLYLQNVKALMS